MTYDTIRSYEGPKDYAFISYSHKNKTVIHEVLRKMQEDNLRFWYDAGIYCGDDWDEVVASYLLGAKCFLAFISEEYVESRNCTDELRLALSKNISIIPVYLDSESRPGYLPNWMQLRLAAKQAIFATSYTLEFYENDAFYARLLKVDSVDCCITKKHALLGGWGPEREMYSYGAMADHAVINSIRDNPAVGDERSFVRIVEVGTHKPYDTGIRIQPGKQYEVWIYFNNGASPLLNKALPSVAKDTKLSVSFSTSLKAGERGLISAVISWYCGTTDYEFQGKVVKNKVWAHADMVSDVPVKVRYVAGSAKIYTGFNKGQVLSTNLFSSSGTYIGTKDLNGIVLAGDEYSGQVLLTLYIEEDGETSLA